MKDILVEQGINEQEINFEQFISILKEIEKRMSHSQNKPNLDKIPEIKPATMNEEGTELILELDAKVLDFLQYENSIVLLKNFKVIGRI